MTSEGLRDTLAIEMAKIVLSKQVGVSSLEDTLEVMTYVYPLADAVLSRRGSTEGLTGQHSDTPQAPPEKSTS